MAADIQRSDEERHDEARQSDAPGDPDNPQVTNQGHAQQDIHECLAGQDRHQASVLIDPDHRGRHDVEAGCGPHRQGKHREHRAGGPRVGRAHPNPDERCPPELEGTASSGKTYATLSMVTFAVGIVGVGTGVTLLLVGNGSGKSPEAALTLGARSANAGATFVGRF